MPELYMVATPIGNLKDITLRALEILSQADAIACEDTRHSLKLLNAHGISKPLISCHSHNEAKASEKVLALLREKKNVAYITDAGTPGISDPGNFLVRTVRDAGFRTVPVPGASALSAIVSISGSTGKRIIFEGFLSPKSGRRKNAVKNLLETGDSFIVYESPFRIIKLLDDLVELCEESENQRNILCGRELTKVHEEILEGSPEEIRDILLERNTVKGEFVLFVSRRTKRS